MPRNGAPDQGVQMNADEICNCEHIDHEEGRGHKMYAVPHGTRRAMHVGLICDECADGHMAEYVGK